MSRLPAGLRSRNRRRLNRSRHLQLESLESRQLLAVVTALAATPVNEGSASTLTVDFTNPGLFANSPTLLVNWGDGGLNQSVALDAGNTQIINAATGEMRTTLPHTYTDDNPSGTNGDTLTIRAAVLDTDTVSYWRFEEPAGNIAIDSFGNNQGTLVGVARSLGLAGTGSLFFSNAPGETVDVGNGASLTVSEGVTVEALIRPTWSGAGGDYDEIYRKEDSDNRVLFSFQNDANNGSALRPLGAGQVLSFGANVGGYGELDMPLGAALTLADGTATGTVYLTDPGIALGQDDVVLKDGATHHIAATYDSATGERAIWVDGVKRFNFMHAAGTLMTSGGGAAGQIGSSNGGENYTGIIDEVAYSKRALTALEISTHSTLGRAGSDYFSMTTTVAVANTPPIFDLGADESINEGGTVVRGAVILDNGTDVFTATVDYGDGTGVQPLAIQGGNSMLLSHTYTDDGTFTVTVVVTDDDNGQTTDTFVVTAANVAPVLAALANVNVNEGDTVSLPPATFTDAGAGDTHTATINWGDGTPVVAGTVDQILRTISGSHAYADEGTFTVVVTVNDGDAGGVASTSFNVNVSNAAPTVVAGADVTITEGGSVSLPPSTFNDPGANDTHTATIDWGDGTAVIAGTVDQILNTVAGSHVYRENGIFTVTVTVTDNDTGVGSNTFQVTVQNALPVVNAGPDRIINDGDTVALPPATFTDAGLDDTHTATIDWGDGSPIVSGTVNQILRTVAGSRPFNGSGTFTVTVTVTDDDGGIGTDSFVVSTSNVNPSVAAGADQTVAEGTSVNVNATFTDPGNDTHTATIDWGDGTITPGVVDEIARTVTGSHAYADNGSYTITVTVTDSDTGVGSDALVATITNVTPTVASLNASVDEDAPLTAAIASITDPGSADTFTALINWNDGLGFVPATVTNRQVFPAAPRIFADPGIYTVVVRVSDDDGATSVDTPVNVTVNNVLPTVFIDGPFTTVRGMPTTFTFSTDEGLVDPDAPTIYNIDWDGDGSVDEIIGDDEEATAGGITVTHIFGFESEVDDQGFVIPTTILVSATDEFGGTGAETAHDIEVKIFDVVTNPDTGFDDLIFGGSILADRIVVSVLGSGGIQIRNNNDFYRVPQTFAVITGKIIIFGGEGGDSINISGSVLYDTELHGGEGNDYIAGGRFDDILNGGEGNDRLIDGFGNNTLIGGDGNDILNGARGNDVIFGGAGRDTIVGNLGHDIIEGGDGNDSIVGMDGNDIIFGGAGNDAIRGDRGHDVLLGGDANDRIEGGPGRDVIIGGGGSDQLYGGADDDIIVHSDVDLGNGPYYDPTTGEIDPFIFEADITVLMSIVTDWLKPTSMTARMTNLEDRLNAATILDDSARDTLYGQTENDWFLTVTEDAVRELRSNDFRQDLDA